MKRSHTIKIEDLDTTKFQNFIKNLSEEECSKIVGGSQDSPSSNTTEFLLYCPYGHENCKWCSDPDKDTI
jgi:hypothetical protein